MCVIYFDTYLSHFCERVNIKIFMDKALILIIEYIVYIYILCIYLYIMYIYILYIYLIKLKFRLDLIIN